MRVFQRFCNRIILAWKATDNHVVIRNGFDGNFGDILIAMPFATEPGDIDVGSMLSFRRRLPLVTPYGVKDVLSGSFQPYAKTADSGEEFDISNFFLCGHIFGIGKGISGVWSGLYFPTLKDQMKKLRNFRRPTGSF